LLADVAFRVVQHLECLERRRRDAVLAEQSLRERLRRLDSGGCARRPEDRKSTLLEYGDSTVRQRRLGPDDRQVDALVLGPRHQRSRVAGRDRDVLGESLGTAVAAGDEEGSVRGVVVELAKERMLASAVADDQDLHGSEASG